MVFLLSSTEAAPIHPFYWALGCKRQNEVKMEGEGVPSCRPGQCQLKIESQLVRGAEGKILGLSLSCQFFLDWGVGEK